MAEGAVQDELLETGSGSPKAVDRWYAGKAVGDYFCDRHHQ